MPTFSKRTIAAPWHASRYRVKLASKKCASRADFLPRAAAPLYNRGEDKGGRGGMIVTCSKCEKRYIVDPRALGSPGRRVRCANCLHTWFEAAPAEAPAAIELPPVPEAPPVVRMTAAPEPEAERRI